MRPHIFFNHDRIHHMIIPTVGRKVWYWPVKEAKFGVTQFNTEMPLDATIIYPHNDTMVNLHVVDHAGDQHFRALVLLHQGDVASRPNSSCATWMPHQLDQAKDAAIIDLMAMPYQAKAT
jgi:hypothetical protein